MDAFYEDIDEVLGPPPARLYRYGSSILLLLLLTLAAIAAFLKVEEGIEGQAYFRLLQSQEIISPAQPSDVVRIAGHDGDSVRPGSILAVLRTGGQYDTLRSALTGLVRQQRRLSAGTTLEERRPLFFIIGRPVRYSIKITLGSVGYTQPTDAGRSFIGRKVTLTPEDNAPNRPNFSRAEIISEPYPDSDTKSWVVDARLSEGMDKDYSGDLPVSPDIRCYAFIATGKKSLLSQVLGF